MIGDAPVPAQWVADRQSKIVQVQDSKELKPCECKTVPILSAVSKGLLKTHKVQSTGRHIHKQVRKYRDRYIGATNLILENKNIKNASSYSELHLQKKALYLRYCRL